MSEKLKYLSPEWRDEAEKRLKAELTPEKMNNITSSMSNVFLNCPGGKDMYLHLSFIGGKLDKCLAGEGALPEAEFKISGDYEVFARISRAELSSQLALMTGKLKLKGNMVKALKLAAISDRINKVFSTIPTQY
ncbi:MAG: SCP2 sterol-binding domain-containing protein [Desulfocucumaceae bacterium]